MLNGVNLDKFLPYLGLALLGLADLQLHGYREFIYACLSFISIFVISEFYLLYRFLKHLLSFVMYLWDCFHIFFQMSFFIAAFKYSLDSPVIISSLVAFIATTIFIDASPIPPQSRASSRYPSQEQQHQQIRRRGDRLLQKVGLTSRSKNDQDYNILGGKEGVAAGRDCGRKQENNQEKDDSKSWATSITDFAVTLFVYIWQTVVATSVNSKESVRGNYVGANAPLIALSNVHASRSALERLSGQGSSRSASIKSQGSIKGNSISYEKIYDAVPNLKPGGEKNRVVLNKRAVVDQSYDSRRPIMSPSRIRRPSISEVDDDEPMRYTRSSIQPKLFYDPNLNPNLNSNLSPRTPTVTFHRSVAYSVEDNPFSVRYSEKAVSQSLIGSDFDNVLSNMEKRSSQSLIDIKLQRDDRRQHFPLVAPISPEKRTVTVPSPTIFRNEDSEIDVFEGRRLPRNIINCYRNKVQGVGFIKHGANQKAVFSRNGLKFNQINEIADGCCLFRALSRAQQGTPDLHLDFRRAIVKYMRENIYYFQNRYGDHIVNDNHLRDMEQNREHGTMAEIEAFAHLYNFHVVVQNGVVESEEDIENEDAWNRLFTGSNNADMLPHNFHPEDGYWVDFQYIPNRSIQSGHTVDNSETKSLFLKKSPDHYDTLLPNYSNTPRGGGGRGGSVNIFTRRPSPPANGHISMGYLLGRGGVGSSSSSSSLSSNVSSPRSSRWSSPRFFSGFADMTDALICNRYSELTPEDNRRADSLKRSPLLRRNVKLSSNSVLRLVGDEGCLLLDVNNERRINDRKLNDECIELYLDLLNEREARLLNLNPKRPRIHFFSPYFIPQLLISYDKISKNKVVQSIFQYDRLYFPVNLPGFDVQGNNSHWALIVLCIDSQSIQYYDSLEGNFPKPDHVFRVLHDMLHRIALGGGNFREEEINEWLQGMSFFDMPTPQQQNYYDCGVFTLACCEILSDLGDLDFDQHYVELYRKKILLRLDHNDIYAV